MCRLPLCSPLCDDVCVALTADESTEMTMNRVLAGLLWLLCASTSWALDVVPIVRISSFRVGLDNASKVGVTTEVQVAIEAAGDFEGDLSLVTPDPRGNPVRITQKFAVKAGQTEQVRLPLTLGRIESHFTIELHQGNHLISRRRLECSENNEESEIRVARHSQPFWLVVGPLAWGQSSVSDSDESSQQATAKLLRRVHHTPLAAATDFPTQSAALSSYDTVFLAGDFKLSDDASKSLERWVKNGGHLVAAIGTRWPDLQASTLSSWLPGKARNVKAGRLTDLSPLVFFSQTEFPLPPVNRVDGSTFTYSDGENVVRTFDGELVVRYAHGFGRVTLVGVDFDKRPLVNWRGLDALVAAIGELGQQEGKTSRGPERLSRTGISELQTQLHTALARFPETTEQSVPNMLGMVLLFLLVIGPIDFFLVQKWLKRPELTWVSFPGVVVLAVLAATVTAGAARGSKVAVQQLDFVDYDANSGHMRQTSWAVTYSPDNRRYSLDFQPNKTVKFGGSVPHSINWLSNPESNYGGMYRVGGFEVGKPEYELPASLANVRNAPIAAGSTRSWRGHFETQIAEPLIESKLERMGVGQFTTDSYVMHHFDGPVDQWMVAYAGRVYFHSVRDSGVMAPSSIAPGQRLDLSSINIRNTDLKSFLTGATYRSHKTRKGPTEDEHFHTITKYDPTGEDLIEISRMISLHHAAGATEYTTLTNSALQQLDWSDLMTLDRAVFFGVLENPASRLAVDGSVPESTRHTVVVRCLIPVKELGEANDSLPKFKSE